MVGFKVTQRGGELLNALIYDVEWLYVPGVNYNRLEQMAITLNKITFTSEDGYFSIDPDLDNRQVLLHIKALERDGYIERSCIPGLERYLKLYEMAKKSPKYKFLLGDGLEDI